MFHRNLLLTFAASTLVFTSACAGDDEDNPFGEGGAGGNTLTNGNADQGTDDAATGEEDAEAGDASDSSGGSGDSGSGSSGSTTDATTSGSTSGGSTGGSSGGSSGGTTGDPAAQCLAAQPGAYIECQQDMMTGLCHMGNSIGCIEPEDPAASLCLGCCTGPSDCPAAPAGVSGVVQCMDGSGVGSPVPFCGITCDVAGDDCGTDMTCVNVQGLTAPICMITG